MKNQKKDTSYRKETIRKLLLSFIRARGKQLSLNAIPAQGPNQGSRYEAIKKLERFLDFAVHKDDEAHINYIVILRDDIATLLPGKESRFQEMKRKILNMLEWCTKHHTLNRQSEFHPVNA